MTSNLPFGLKVKPSRHYFSQGMIKFSAKEGKLFYSWMWISKGARGTIRQGEVKSKEHLQALLKVKHVDEQPLLTEVVN